MPAEFLSAAALVLSWSATYLIHSTGLFAGVWLFLRFHRTAGHALRETLWKTALVGSIVTASAQMLPAPRPAFTDITVSIDELRSPPAVPLASAESRDPAAGTGSSKADAGQARAAAAEATGTGEPDSVLWIVSAAVVPDAPGGTSGFPAAAVADVRDPGTARKHAASHTWGILKQPATLCLALTIATALMAILLGIARCVWQTWSLRRKIAGCSIVNAGPGRRLLDEMRRLVPRAPDVLLLSSPDDPEPAAFGITQWTIVLPARAETDLSEDELRALLAHELAHLVRGDSRWLWISRVACSCLAFQPLNHLARREWQRAAEFLCDSWAVSRTGTPLALARCLAEVAGWRLTGRPSAALLAATGRKSGLAGRIERLLEAADLSETWTERHSRRRLLLVGGILLGFVTWCAPRVHLAAASVGPAQAAGFPGAPPTGQAETVREGRDVVVSAVQEGALPTSNADAVDADTHRGAPAEENGSLSVHATSRPTAATPRARSSMPATASSARSARGSPAWSSTCSRSRAARTATSWARRRAGRLSPVCATARASSTPRMPAATASTGRGRRSATTPAPRAPRC
jgi:hypothetical protein